MRLRAQAGILGFRKYRSAQVRQITDQTVAGLLRCSAKRNINASARPGGKIILDGRQDLERQRR
jgi:hypothetical protein